MNTDQLQKVIIAYQECCNQINTAYTNIDINVENWYEAVLLCCQNVNSELDDIIDVLEDWAADYEATYSGYLCQRQDNEVIERTITFENYLCQQVTTTTTSTTTTTVASTTTTTIDPDLVEWSVGFDDYLCMQEYDPAVTVTTTVDETVTWEAEYTYYLCEKEDDPSAVTTTITTSATTTTTTVDPDDVTFSATYTNYLCEKEDDPLAVTTTTTVAIDEDDVDFDIAFKEYLCQQEDVTTTTTTIASTTTTTGATTTTTTGATTTTTTKVAVSCSSDVSGEMEFPKIYEVTLGSDTGIVTLTFDTVDVPDKFIVEFDGAEVINTGYRGNATHQTPLYNALATQGAPAELISGSASGSETFNKTTSTSTAIVKVYAPIEETEWTFNLSCPVAVATTTTTVEGTAFEAEYTDYLCEEEDNGVSTTTTTTTTSTTTSTTTTTAAATTTTTGIGLETVSCGNEQSGEQVFPKVFIVTLGSGTGAVHLIHDAINIPDKIIVDFDGKEVINTGYVGHPSYQYTLDAELTKRGLATETIVSDGAGVNVFSKNTSTTFAVVKVFAPIKETQWSFTLSCPGATTTTSTTTTTVAATTTTTVVSTTTTTAAATTTTTNALPVSSDNSVVNDRYTEGCGNAIQLTPSDFTFSDAEGDALEYVKINSYSLTGAGTLTYNGSTVTNGQALRVIGGASGSFLYDLIYTPDSSNDAEYSDTIDFSVRTKNNTTYG